MKPLSSKGLKKIYQKKVREGVKMITDNNANTISMTPLSNIALAQSKGMHQK